VKAVQAALNTINDQLERLVDDKDNAVRKEAKDMDTKIRDDLANITSNITNSISTVGNLVIENAVKIELLNSARIPEDGSSTVPDTTTTEPPAPPKAAPSGRVDPKKDKPKANKPKVEEIPKKEDDTSDDDKNSYTFSGIVEDKLKNSKSQRLRPSPKAPNGIVPNADSSKNGDKSSGALPSSKDKPKLKSDPKETSVPKKESSKKPPESGSGDSGTSDDTNGNVFVTPGTFSTENDPNGE